MLAPTNETWQIKLDKAQGEELISIYRQNLRDRNRELIRIEEERNKIIKKYFEIWIQEIQKLQQDKTITGKFRRIDNKIQMEEEVIRQFGKRFWVKISATIKETKK